MDDPPASLDIFRTALPMRTFSHATAERKEAQAIIIRLRTRSGRVGWGESLPRPYVTGETYESVVKDIERIFWPILRDADDATPVETLVHELPCHDGDRIVTAARCAVELAMISAYNVDWRATLGAASDSPLPPVTGVIGSANPRKTARKLRAMRLYGLRDFKLKLGFDDETDRANLRAVTKQLGGKLADCDCTLRVDVNGAWKYKDTPERVAELVDYGVCAVEQPCAVRPGRMADLAYECSLPLIADESCLTEEDAEILFGAEGRVWLNIRLAKNGGLIPAMRMALRAGAERTPFVLGCLVGESGILSLAQRQFLTASPTPRMIEGNYGRFLLKDDLVIPSPRFGYRGRLQITDTGGAGRPRADKFRRYARLLRQLDE